jgi:predicted DNA-binding ribbon-helix-helix protein
MTLRKRTIRLAQHNTSIALEPEFWAALEQLAARHNQTLPQLIAAIDSQRSGGLASALRVAALQQGWKQA